MVERKKQTRDHRHPMFGEVQITSQLKSRKPFMKTSKPITELPIVTRLKKWPERLTDSKLRAHYMGTPERIPPTSCYDLQMEHVEDDYQQDTIGNWKDWREPVQMGTYYRRGLWVRECANIEPPVGMSYAPSKRSEGGFSRETLFKRRCNCNG